jgi:Domain of unknown function (DUF4349)
MSKNIHPIEQEELMAYLDGELEADRASIAASHLERCKECQELADDLRDVSQKLMAWQVSSSDKPVSPEMASALEEAPEKNAPERRNAGTPRWKTWRESWSTRRLLWASSFATICFAVVIGVSRLRMEKAPAPVRQVISQNQMTTELYAPAPTRSSTTSRKNADSSFSYSTDQAFSSGSNYDEIKITGATASLNSPGLLPPPPPPAPQAKKEQRRDSATPSGPMVVRTVELSLITSEFDQARKSLEDTMKRHHGYFGNLAAGGAADAGRTLDAILRVPADQLEAALAELKTLGRVESESQKGDEVSQQYVDLQARLVNARNTEQRLTDLLRERTGRLSDVLEVEQQIDSVRERIEQMDAEKKNLANQVAFATLTMKIREDYKAHVQMVPPSTSSRVRNAAVDGYETMEAGLINIALFLVSWGPSFLLWFIVLFFPVRSLWRRVRRTRAA